MEDTFYVKRVFTLMAYVHICLTILPGTWLDIAASDAELAPVLDGLEKISQVSLHTVAVLAISHVWCSEISLFYGLTAPNFLSGSPA